MLKTFSLPSVIVILFGAQYVPMEMPLNPMPAPSSTTFLPANNSFRLIANSAIAIADSHTFSPVVPCEILFRFSFNTIDSRAVLESIL